LGIESTQVFHFISRNINQIKNRKKLKNQSYQSIYLDYSEEDLSTLQKLVDPFYSNKGSRYSINYTKGKGFTSELEDPQKNSLSYCSGKYELRKNKCKSGFLESLKKPCKKCKNYKKFILAEQNHTNNTDSQNTIQSLNKLSKQRIEEIEYSPSETDLSRLGRMLL